VTEVESAYFSEVCNIQETNIWILIIAVIVVTLFLAILIAHVTEPVERLTATVGSVAAAGDLSQRAEIEFADEIGKRRIPDAVLLKAGQLTGDEFEIMKQHRRIGYDLLKDARSVYLVEGARIALSHHERRERSGYPAGTRGEDIPLSGRIVGIVDVFDALTSTRTYKEAWSFERTRDYIAWQRGRHFDPHLVDVLLENFPAFERCLTRTEPS